MHESFLTCRNFLFLKISLAAMAIAILAYVLHSPDQPPNGGTWLGYTLGTIAALLILWLLWFGVRKRQYSSTQGKVSEWLSAHVYFGAALLVLATLHCGFQFGWNIHTLAYALMVIVILSGFFGVIAYVRYPKLLAANRDRKDVETMLVEIGDLDEELVTVARDVNDEVHKVTLQMIEATDFNPGLISQSREALDNNFGELMQSINKKVASVTQIGAVKRPDNPQSTTMIQIGGKTVFVDMSNKNDAINSLFGLLGTRTALVKRVQRDVLYHRLLKEWLFVHVPMSFALIAALIAHIVSVLFYW